MNNGPKMTNSIQQEFVDFVARGSKKFPGDADFLREWPLASLWTPFYTNCPVCNPSTNNLTN